MKARLLTLAIVATGIVVGGSPIHAQDASGLAPAVTATSTTLAAAASGIAVPDPAAQIEELARLFRAGDLAALAQASIPPSQWQQIRAAWELERREPITDAERVRFAEKLARISAPDAVEQIMAEVEPKLDEARPQVPGALLMGFGAMHMAIASPDSDLTDAQRTALEAALPGIQRWAGATDFLDAATLRDALTLLVDAVRRSGIQNLDQLRALSLDELLRRGGGVLAAAKDAVQLYGVDVDAIADSVRVEVLENDGETARVRTTVTVFGAPVFGEHDLVLVDGRWYGKQAVVRWSHDDADTDTAGENQPVEG